MRQIELIWWFGIFGAVLAVAGMIPAFLKIGIASEAPRAEASSSEAGVRGRAKTPTSWHTTARYLGLMLAVAILGVAWLQGQATAWLSIAAAIILFGGFAGVGYAFCGWNSKFSLTRVFRVNAVTAAMVILLWTILGYTMAMSEGSAAIGGFSRAFLKNTGGVISWGQAELSEATSVLLYTTVAVLATTIAATAAAPRTKFVSQIWFVGIWVLFVYAPILHWVWGPGGWLSNPASDIAYVLDGAGGVVIFSVAGAAGVASLFALEHRRFEPSIKEELISNGTALLTVVGVALIASFATAGTDLATTLLATLVTTVAAVFGASFTAWILEGRPSLATNCAGVLAGVAASASGAGILPLHFAPLVGIIAGVLGIWSIKEIGRAAPYCTALAAGGLAGSLVTSLLTAESWRQVWLAYEGAAIVVGYDVLATLVIWRILDWLVGRPETVDNKWTEPDEAKATVVSPTIGT